MCVYTYIYNIYIYYVYIYYIYILYIYINYIQIYISLYINMSWWIWVDEKIGNKKVGQG